MLLKVAVLFGYILFASTLILINDVANKCSRRLKQTSFSDALLQAL